MLIFCSSCSLLLTFFAQVAHFFAQVAPFFTQIAHLSQKFPPPDPQKRRNPNRLQVNSHRKKDKQNESKKVFQFRVFRTIQNGEIDDGNGGKRV